MPACHDEVMKFTNDTRHLRVGMTVRSVIVSWGEGVIEELRTDPRLKAVVVRRADGALGHFFPGQVEVVA